MNFKTACSFSKTFNSILLKSLLSLYFTEYSDPVERFFYCWKITKILSWTWRHGFCLMIHKCCLILDVSERNSRDD